MANPDNTLGIAQQAEITKPGNGLFVLLGSSALAITEALIKEAEKRAVLQRKQRPKVKPMTRRK